MKSVQFKLSETLCTQLLNGFKNSICSDVTLVIWGQKIQCHKFILSVWSPVLHSVVTKNWKESTSNEIIIDENEVQGFKEMINFFTLEV